MPNELEIKVKLALYNLIAETGSVPGSADIARAIDLEENKVQEAFSRLHAQRLVVPEPKDPSRLRMAPPFSGVPTSFPVEARGKRYYANCVWDAFGVAAALHCDAVIPACDGFSGDPLELEVKDSRPVPQDYVAHFAVPAAHWWDDIVFT
jgi:Alkylmercury lyase